MRIAIDDFGTGYSSLSYLHRFPVDVLKIDRSFIERLSTGGDTALVSTILRLGQTLHLETVAEGIERPQEMLMLRRQGCTTGQGFHFSPPVPAAAVDALLADQLHVADDVRGADPGLILRSPGRRAPRSGHGTGSRDPVTGQERRRTGHVTGATMLRPIQ